MKSQGICRPAERMPEALSSVCGAPHITLLPLNIVSEHSSLGGAEPTGTRALGSKCDFLTHAMTRMLSLGGRGMRSVAKCFLTPSTCAEVAQSKATEEKPQDFVRKERRGLSPPSPCQTLSRRWMVGREGGAGMVCPSLPVLVVSLGTEAFGPASTKLPGCHGTGAWG